MGKTEVLRLINPMTYFLLKACSGARISRFRLSPESSVIHWLRRLWTPEPALDPDPGFTGVTAFYETISFWY